MLNILNLFLNIEFFLTCLEGTKIILMHLMCWVLGLGVKDKPEQDKRRPCCINIAFQFRARWGWENPDKHLIEI